MELVTSTVGSLAAEIAKYSVAPIARQFGYLIYYNRNIKSLENEARKLADRREEVQLSVEDAERNLRVIAPTVVHWQNHVDDINQEVREFLENTIKGNHRSSNLISRYSLSREANKKAQQVMELREEAGKFGQIAYPGPPPKIGSLYGKVIKDVESRLSIMDEVLEALNNDRINMIGISGMGGVGKTKMAKDVMKRVGREDLFDEVAMAVVSQDPNLMKIQDEIADRLGLNFDDKKSVAGRANKLLERVLKTDKRILIILDDVWKAIDLEEIGLPSGGKHKGCKIVLTSRSEDVCNQMRSQRIIAVPVLSDDEAWHLFREMAGAYVDRPDFHPIAKEVADECGGLPLAIVTVARALEGKRRIIWEDALRQLKNSNPTNISGMQKDVYSRIELSYNYLESDEAKSCFLLCCFFPEDFNIPIEVLVRYGMGLRLFGEFNDLSQARISVHSLIDKLKRLFLLLDGDGYMHDGNGCDHIKMHDVVRDVALSIASKREHAFLARNNAVMIEWPKKETCRHYTAVSLRCRDLKELPDKLKISKLELLELVCDSSSQTLPDNFFQGMKELKVLSLNTPLLPESVKVQKNLRTLCLHDYASQEVVTIGSLVNLEILQISSSDLSNLPGQIGLLRNLQLLDLRRCDSLRYISPGVLSSLSNLEELYMPQHFQYWETDGNTSLRELESHHLNALQIWVPNSSLLPRELALKSLVRFKIFVGRSFFPQRDANDFPSTNELCLEGDMNDVIGSGIYSLLRKTECLILKHINVKHVFSELDEEAFLWLNKLSVIMCPELEYVVDATELIPHVAFPLIEEISLNNLHNLKEIWHGQPPKISTEEQRELGLNPTGEYPASSFQSSSFRNLRDLHVSQCNKLTYLFTLSMARGLQQLQRLIVDWSQGITGVLCKNEQHDEKITVDEIELRGLTDLTLNGLPKLIGFWVAMDTAASELLPDGSDDEAMKPSSLNSKEMSASRMNKMSKVKHDQVQVEDSSESRTRSAIIMTSMLFRSSCPQLLRLEKLEVKSCNFLTAVFSRSVAEKVAQLEQLTIEHCKNMEYIVAGGAEEENKGVNGMIFPRLNTLQLGNLPKLAAFFSEFDAPKVKTNTGDDSTLHEGNSKTQTSMIIRKREGLSLRSLLLCKCAKMERPRSAISEPPRTSTTIGHDSEAQERTSKEQSELAICCKELKKMTLWRLPKLRHVFSTPRTVVAFQKLQKLEVRFCHGLRSIFTVSVAKGLLQLEELSVSSCEMLGVIVSKEDEEEQEARNDQIVFPQLRSLELWGLHKLSSFYGGVHAIELPSLEIVAFFQCHTMNTFSYGSPITPKLNEVDINLKLQPLTGDLNSILQRYKEQETTLDDGTFFLGREDYQTPSKEQNELLHREPNPHLLAEEQSDDVVEDE